MTNIPGYLKDELFWFAAVIGIKICDARQKGKDYNYNWNEVLIVTSYRDRIENNRLDIVRSKLENLAWDHQN